MLCGRGNANGTGKSSGITEWWVIKARSDVNSLVKPWKWISLFVNISLEYWIWCTRRELCFLFSSYWFPSELYNIQCKIFEDKFNTEHNPKATAVYFLSSCCVTPATAAAAAALTTSVEYFPLFSFYYPEKSFAYLYLISTRRF